MNTTDQQIDTDQDEHQADPKNAQLRQTLENLTLQKMIDQVQQQDLNHKELCDILHTCYQHKKADAVEEKTRSTERIAMHRLNKTNQSTKPINSNRTYPNENPTNPDATPANPDDDRLPLRDPSSPQTQPGDLDDPNTNPTEQSHQLFCRNLARAAMDIWGVDISKVCKTEKPQNEESDPSATDNLYDIPPEHRQGATPIQGSQEKYGQPKYTRKEWRRVMFRAIRENYGVYDDPQPSPKTQTPARIAGKDRPNTQQHQPKANPGTANPPFHANRPSPCREQRASPPCAVMKHNGTPRRQDQACRLAALPDRQTIHGPPTKPKTTNPAQLAQAHTSQDYRVLQSL